MTNGGIVVGLASDASWRWLTDARGQRIAPGTSQSGAGAAINERGQFVAVTLATCAGGQVVSTIGDGVAELLWID